MCVYYARCTQLASHKLCIGRVMNMLNRDLGTGDLCDNIGLIGVSAKWSYVTASPSHHDQAIPILSPCFLCMLAIPIFPFFKFEEFLIYLSRLLFQTGSDPSIYNVCIIIILNQLICPFSTLVPIVVVQ